MMLDKINVLCIIADHFKTLKNDNTDKAEFKDYFLFLFLPMLPPLAFLLLGQLLSHDFINILITILAIFVGLLLNVLVVIFDIIKKSQDKLKLRIIQETYSNISFAILLSIITILPLIVCYIDDNEKSCYYKILRYAFNGISYYLLGLFFITLLMIVERIHVILSDEMQNSSPS